MIIQSESHDLKYIRLASVMNVGNYGKSRLSEGSTTLSAKPDSVEVGNRQPCTLSQNDLI